MENNSISPYCFVLITILLCFQMHSKADAHTPYMEIPVGVILDMGSWVGKSVFSCINIVVSEFYALNTHYKTRIVLHHRDTHGEPRHALSAALDLLEKSKVQALLGSQSIAEAKLLAVLGEQAEIPILSLSPIPYSNTHPYFIQITQDETTQVKAIASMASSFGWKDAIVIFEDTEDGREMATYITTSLQEKSISITYMTPISTSSSNEVLREELHKLRIMQTKLFILHTSHPLAFHLLKNAKYLGMMDAGPSQTQIEMEEGISCDEHEDISTYAIAACDGIMVLAMAIEKTQSVLRLNVTDSTPWLLKRRNHVMEHEDISTFESDVKNLI
ncbi:hypothetical protein QVD17_02763 [Tagetes erecta]|uniref:Receptor ligand binding region domain-containing protein n=1 Tax=Tagetes erecta TaxID=13708 RepID=A0AAD8L764_TARER|nr:hypothetical protein QVD17_02763 [Tagetes erecta]